jgi:hypothetical protein
MTPDYEQAYDGEWWEYKPETYVACCDCGLVHRVRIRRRNRKVFLQFTTDRRRTGQVRRHMK